MGPLKNDQMKKQSLSPILDCSGVVQWEIGFMEEFMAGVLSGMERRA
jgi:hypothetical protein